MDLSENLAQDYADIFEKAYSLTHDHKNKLDELIEELLSQLEEFCAILEEVRQNSSDVESSVLKLSKRNETLKILYSQIDSIEHHIGDISRSLDILETSLKDLQVSRNGSLSSIKKYLFKLPGLSSFSGGINYQNQDKLNDDPDIKSLIKLVSNVNIDCREKLRTFHEQVQVQSHQNLE